MLNNLKRSVLALAVIGISIFSFAQSSVKAVPHGWHLKDQATTGFYGISLDKAYDFVKGKKSQQVIVAIIDSGIDTTHEDLKPVLWTNPKEIPGNGIDDDGDGYVDDVHGWNFLGGRDGRNVKEDADEGARVYYTYKSRFENIKDTNSLSKDDKYLYDTWRRAEAAVKGIDVNQAAQLKFIYPNFIKGDSVIRKDLKKEEYTGEDLKNYKPSDPYSAAISRMILSICESEKKYDISNKDLLEELESEIRKADNADNPPKNYRGDIVKDNEEDLNDKFYGNNDIQAGFPMHGTHVAGIIGAVRNNGKGVDGIADNVRLMMLRVVPDGDEHDKDIALAIRYAVDHGAKVINMSFGKSFSPHKAWIDDAVRYADSKGVLLVHAAGNDSKNLDSSYNYPTPVLLNDGKAPNWIEVGASSDPKEGGLVAYFSNYSKNLVDVFAPGFDIYSTVDGNKYKSESGTSMASPVVAGVAAFLLEYYPTLTPEQVKMVIEKSAVAPKIKATNPGTGEQVSLSELSRTGGIVNAYEAAKLAQQITSQNLQPVKTKMKVKQAKRA